MKKRAYTGPGVVMWFLVAFTLNEWSWEAEQAWPDSFKIICLKTGIKNIIARLKRRSLGNISWEANNGESNHSGVGEREKERTRPEKGWS